MIGAVELKGILQRLIPKLLAEVLPGLRGGYIGTRKARVVRVRSEAGRVDTFHARYAVDVQPLLADGSDDKTAPVIPLLPLPVLWVGPKRGLFALPAVGAVIELGFRRGDLTQPYVSALYADGCDVPAVAEGEVLLAHSDGIELRFAADGTVRLKSSMKVVLEAPAVELGATATQKALLGELGVAWMAGHSHLEHGAPSPLTTDGLLSEVVKVSP